MTKEGSIEVITGCMFSGKTDELLERAKQVEIARQKLQFFKPSIDTRYDGVGRVVSHSGNEAEAIGIDHKRPERIIAEVEEDTQVVIIDEAQFFLPKIVDVISLLADQGKRVIVAGLDLNFRGEPFGPMPFILSIAEKINKLTVICECEDCEKEATKTQRLIDGEPADYNTPEVVIGGAESYAAKCRRHHIVPNKPIKL